MYNAFIAPINPKKPDEILYKDLIKSTYPDAGPLGLLGYRFMNLPPGKYRIVAFNTSWNNEQYRRSETIALYLSKEDMKKTEFEISPSQLKVLGRFNFDYSEFSGNIPFYAPSFQAQNLAKKRASYCAFHSVTQLASNR